MAGRRKWAAEKSYLYPGDIQVALDAMDETYGQRDEKENKPQIFRSIGPGKIATYWAHPTSASAYLDSKVNIGIRGRVWAACLVLARNGKVSSQSTLARAMAKFATDHGRVAQLKARHPVLDLDLLKLLGELISPFQGEACPEIELADDLLQLVEDYCVSELFEAGDRTGLAELFHQTLRISIARPSALYNALAGVVPARPASEAAKAAVSRPRPLPRETPIRPDELNTLDASIDRVSLKEGAGRRYEGARPQDFADGDVEDLVTAITRGDRDKKRWIVVSGPRFCGKKAKVEALLRRLANDDDILVARIRSLKVDLPICGQPAKGAHYRKLVTDVIEFLERYRKAMGRSLDYLPALSLSTATLDEMFERVRLLHEGTPALYVFTDVDAFSSDFDRNVIRDVGMRRLIQALLQSNDQSMVLITTNTDLEKNKKYVTGMPPYEQILVKAPTLSSFENFIRKEVRSEKTDSLFFHEEYDTLRGDDLICIASIINLAGGLTAEHRKTCETFIGTAPNSRRERRFTIYEALIDVVKSLNLLHAVALIAATDDGLLDASLSRLLTEWSQYDVKAAPPSDLSPKLNDVMDKTDSKLLSYSRMVRYDAEEFGPAEKHSETSRVWELDPVVGAMFLDALADAEPRLAREAHRLIAKAARERAQTKKIRMRSPLGSRVTEDASRDIQSYVCLLASIEPETEPTKTDELPLRLTEHQVFSLDPDVFRARRALRFAVLCLLKEDIDHDHRLTMVFDEDALRLELYILLFQPLGRRHRTLVELLPLPSSLPTHLSRNYFSDDQLMSLMSTVALSAYHAQRFDVVLWISDLCEKVAIERDIPDYPEKMVRVWCSLIDACILRGGAEKDGNHEQTLEFVTGLREKHFRKADFRKVRSSIEGSKQERQSMAWLRADMRLLAREAELQGLIGNRTLAENLYAQLERDETRLAERFTDHEPVVLSGRVARRYIKFLLQSSTEAETGAVEGPDVGDILRARELLGVNASRLRRFSGADRVGVMIDQARLALASGDLPAALSWAEAANVRAQSGTVSHGGRLEALVVCIDMRLRATGETDVQEASRLLRLSGEAIAELQTIAAALEYRPFFGIAAHLDSRRLWLECQIGENHGLSDGIKLKEARKRAALADRRLDIGPHSCADRSFAQERQLLRRALRMEDNTNGGSGSEG